MDPGAVAEMALDDPARSHDFRAAAGGDADATEQLFMLLFRQLHRLAQREANSIVIAQLRQLQ